MVKLKTKLYCIYTDVSTHKIISILFKIAASALFLKFRKFQPRYSYKLYSYRKKECIGMGVFAQRDTRKTHSSQFYSIKCLHFLTLGPA